MTYISVDVETDGPCPGEYSMISFGAVVVDPDGKFDQTFKGELKPISEKYVPAALMVSGHSREDTLKFDDPSEVMHKFYDWLIAMSKNQKIYFLSDNNGFDWQFINYYFHRFVAKGNPFGHSSTNLGSLYKGMVKDTFQNFKHLRSPYKHTHDPVDDARGNANAFLRLVKEHGLKVKL